MTELDANAATIGTGGYACSLAQVSFSYPPVLPIDIRSILYVYVNDPFVTGIKRFQS
ncbi:MAG: hypothetical protein ACXVI3_02095 [Halobacteriota archaeon]